MNRATGAAAARAAARLLEVRDCNCHQAQELQRRIATALPFVVAAIGELDRVPSTTIANDSDSDAATLALLNVRRALSALENEG